MAELTPDIAEQVQAVCQAAAAETGEALTHALGVEVSVTPGESRTLDPATLPEEFNGAGLAISLVVGDSAAVAFLPAAGGLLPDWYAAPDATGEAQLLTLSQALGRLLLPAELEASESHAAGVDSFAAALVRGEAAAGAALLPLELKAADDRQSALYLIWPVGSADKMFPAEASAGAGASSEDDAASKAAAAPDADVADDTAAPMMTAAATRPPVCRVASIDQLPPYAKSLLRIKVPVIVTLASKRQPLDRIIELGPGAIITFDKSCEEMLDLHVDGVHVASGEAVKVGDKFGLRVTSIILPDERFKPLRAPRLRNV